MTRHGASDGASDREVEAMNLWDLQPGLMSMYQHQHQHQHQQHHYGGHHDYTPPDEPYTPPLPRRNAQRSVQALQYIIQAKCPIIFSDCVAGSVHNSISLYRTGCERMRDNVVTSTGSVVVKLKLSVKQFTFKHWTNASYYFSSWAPWTTVPVIDCCRFRNFVVTNNYEIRSPPLRLGNFQLTEVDSQSQ